MTTHRRESTSPAAVSLALACVLLALAFAGCGGSGATAAGAPAVAPSEATLMVAASPSAMPLPKGAGYGTIAFTRVASIGDGSMDICVVRGDGTGLRRLAADAEGTTWSPDGSKIAYTSLSRGGVWVMDADGFGKRRVTPAGADWVAWSPDGRQILFSTTAFSSLPVVNGDGSGRGLRSVRTLASGSRGYSPAPAEPAAYRRDGGEGEICWSIPAASSRSSRQPVWMNSLSNGGKWLAIHEGGSDCLVRLAASGRGMTVVIIDEVSLYQRGPTGCHLGHRTGASSRWASTRGGGWGPGPFSSSRGPTARKCTRCRTRPVPTTPPGGRSSVRGGAPPLRGPTRRAPSEPFRPSS